MVRVQKHAGPTGRILSFTTCAVVLELLLKRTRGLRR